MIEVKSPVQVQAHFPSSAISPSGRSDQFKGRQDG